MIDLEELTKENQVQTERIAEIGNSLNISSLKEELINLEKQTETQDFWNDTENSKKVLADISNLKKKVSNYSNTENNINTIKEMIELLKTEQDDEIEKELKKLIVEANNNIDELEISTLLSGKYDKNNAIITIHPGAGGTEAQDWAEMLYRMYTRWAEANRFSNRRTRLSRWR